MMAHCTFTQWTRISPAHATWLLWLAFCVAQNNKVVLKTTYWTAQTEPYLDKYEQQTLKTNIKGIQSVTMYIVSDMSVILSTCVMYPSVMSWCACGWLAEWMAYINTMMWQLYIQHWLILCCLTFLGTLFSLFKVPHYKLPFLLFA